MISDQIDDVLFILIHFFFIVLGQPGIEHQVVIERLYIGEGQYLSFDCRFDVGALHEVGVCDFVRVIKMFLGKPCNRGYLINSKLILILFEEIEQVLIEYTQA